MGSAERRQRESQETRQKIMDAARDLFVSRGYDATSMRAVAKRIEYTPTAIYHHFESKEHLLREICSADFRNLAGVFHRLGRIDDPVERLHRIGEAYVHFGLENPMHYQLMFMAVRPTPEDDHGPVKGDPSEDAYAFLLQTVEEAMKAGRFLPEYDDPGTVAQILWGSLHGLVSLSIAKGHDAWVEFRDVEETARHAREVLLRGLLR